MTVKVPRAAAAVAMLALTLAAGCGGKALPAETTQLASPAPTRPALPVPVLKVGEAFTVDLLGDGQANVTVVAAEVSAGRLAADPSAPQGKVQLVATVKIVLNKAGKPIAGGPKNFIFRDTGSMLHPARTNRDAFSPELVAVNFTTAGQQTSGKIVFDVPADLVDGGQIQLVSGQLVVAVWKV